MLCAASGWQLGAGCLTSHSQVVCPVCDRSVPARSVRRGVIEVDAHPPASPATCGGCGTVHTEPTCPTCRQAIGAGDAVLSCFVFAGRSVAVPSEAS
jgi:hypothetical protein